MPFRRQRNVFWLEKLTTFTRYKKEFQNRTDPPPNVIDWLEHFYGTHRR